MNTFNQVYGALKEAVFKDEITCKQLGLISSLESAGITNYTKITAAILSGKRILIDDIYYLSNANLANIVSITNLSFIGITNNAELKFNGQHYLWKPLDGSTIDKMQIEDLKLTNIAVTHSQNNAVRFIYSPNTENFYIKQFTIKNCQFTKGFGMFQGYCKMSDPNVITYGFGEIRIVDNTFKDASWWQSFFNLQDYPHDLIEFRKNKVYNFTNVFMNCGISNENTYNQVIATKMKKLIWKDNYFYNDDTFWDDSTSTGSYFTPIIYEGFDCEFSGNHNEGFKTDNNIRVVYDGYLSCEHLVSYNNVYKNIIHTNPGATYSALMKCKGSTVGITNTTRYIHDNKYYVDEVWATTVATARGTNINKVSHSIIDIVQGMKNVEIFNNYFDMYYLDISIGSGSPLSNLIIRNNTILAKYITGYLCFAFSLNETSRSVICIDNIIRSFAIGTTGMHGASTFVPPTLGYIISSAVIPSVKICNNDMNTHGLPEAIIRGYSPTQPTVTDFVFNSNKINITAGAETTTMNTIQSSGFKITRLEAKGNDITINYTQATHYGVLGMYTPIKHQNIKYNIAGMLRNASYITGFSGDYDTTKTQYLRLTFKVQTKVSYDEFYADLKYYYSSGDSRNALAFTNASATPVIALLVKQADALSVYSSQHNVQIKLNAITPAALPAHTLTLINNSTGATVANDEYARIYLTLANNANTDMVNIEVDVKTIVEGN
jgi:hypothetical protein